MSEVGTSLKNGQVLGEYLWTMMIAHVLETQLVNNLENEDPYF